MTIAQTIVTILFLVNSILSLTLMFVDKRRAVADKWRIPEWVLFLPAVLLGGIGGTLGMELFRHKTKHKHFKILFPIFALISLAVFLLVYLLPI